MKKVNFTAITLILILICSVLFLPSCEIKSEENYRLVEPTDEELSEFPQRLDYILCMFHRDYNSETDRKK